MREDLKNKLQKAKPVFDAVFSGKAKPSPHLTAYIAHASRMPSRIIQNLLIGFAAVFGGFICLALALVLLIKGLWLPSAAVFVGYPIFWSAAAWGISRLRGPKTPRDKRKLELSHAARAMEPYMIGRRLPRTVGPATTTLLEESARNWNRTTTALNEPFWTDENLPAHWRSLREHVLESVDDAMGDLIFLTQPHMKPINKGEDWKDFLGGLLGMSDQPDHEPLPPMFGTAREIAEKLKLLAEQVEQASQQVIREQPDSTAIPSATSLDACLSELKSIQQAEGELRQNIGG